MAPKDKRNSDQAEALAYRAAVIVAQRNILEVIKGVHIDSTTIVENKIVTDERVVSTIQGLVRFSNVDYSKKLVKDTVEVGVSMPLWGKLADILITRLEEPRQPSKATATGANLEDRLDDLEWRIRTLEKQISGLKKISAKETFEGDRSLLVEPQSYTILKAIAEIPDNILADCRVVIVF